MFVCLPTLFNLSDLMLIMFYSSMPSRCLLLSLAAWFVAVRGSRVASVESHTRLAATIDRAELTAMVNRTSSKNSAEFADMSSSQALVVADERVRTSGMATSGFAVITAVIAGGIVAMKVGVITAVTVGAAAGGGICVGGLIIWLLLTFATGATVTYGGVKLAQALASEQGFTKELLSRAISQSVAVALTVLEDSVGFDELLQNGRLATKLNMDVVAKERLDIISEEQPTETSLEVVETDAETADEADDENEQETKLQGVIFVSPGRDKDLIARTRKTLVHIAHSCKTALKPKGLGDSESSSRSGAMFWSCAKSAAGGLHNRVLIKGGIRDSPSSPEWSSLQTLMKRLDERFFDNVMPTLLNRMLIGFTAFDTNWIALEDIGAGPLFDKLAFKRTVTFHVDWEEFEEDGVKFFDVKPVPSRAPQMPDLMLRLRALRKEMGIPLKDFHGWAALRKSLVTDLIFLDEFNVIDESLIVQVAGPVTVSYAADKDVVSALNEVLFGGSPRCAFHLREREVHRGAKPEDITISADLSVVCVTVLDYLLTLSPVKHIQNAIQKYRWNAYGKKLLKLFDCLGDATVDACESYRRIEAGGWREVWQEEFKANKDLMAVTKKVEQDYRCCCDLQNEPYLTPDTPCRWYKTGDTWLGSCPGGVMGLGGLTHVPAEEAGCSDVDPPEAPPQPECALEAACCCDEAGIEQEAGGVKVLGFKNEGLNTIYLPGKRSTKKRKGSRDDDVFFSVFESQDGKNSTEKMQQSTSFVQTQKRTLQKESVDEGSGDLCNMWLLVEYDGGTPETRGAFGFRAGEWDEVFLGMKLQADGTYKTYRANCKAGGIVVKTATKYKVSNPSTRCLKPTWMCWVASRRTSIGPGDTMELENAATLTTSSFTLTSGHVRFTAVTPEKGEEFFANIRDFVPWFSSDGTYIVYRCARKQVWYVEERRKLMNRHDNALYDYSACTGVAYTSALDWTSETARWFERRRWGQFSIGWTERYTTVLSDMSAAEVLVPLGRCGCSEGSTCAPGLREMAGPTNRAAYCPLGGAKTGSFHAKMNNVFSKMVGKAN
eukprot:TRINITY_DN18437_c0_g1_i1.p1 TRINITY_DN18437_c0_g1~~TRINITY_DN18437_c0_g1_i1.p1  ORF type:complete len:1058 (-),score=216.57 TRINITY_DN18437_c0_g1_i1:222-3395(-)